MAREVLNPRGSGLDVLDITVQRNGYGRQSESRVVRATTDFGAADWIEAVLIRAPRIVRVGVGVRVCARLGDDPIWVESDQVIATTFHPELSNELRVHRRFLERAANAAAYRERAA